MDPAARTARARVAALARHRKADDPALIEARNEYAGHLAQILLERLTPEKRSRLLEALTSDEDASPSVLEPEPATP